MSAATWTSKLGNKYPKEQIDLLDREHHEILQRLRKQPANAVCAECEECETLWASVSLGVFVCMQCSDVHRALGTHISKVKGCSGTYLWGPDEISRMQALGNAEVRRQLGSVVDECRPSRDASKEKRVALCTEKYEGFTLSAAVASSQPSSMPVISFSGPALGAAAAASKVAVVPEPCLFDDLFKDFDVAPEAQSAPPAARPAASRSQADRVFPDLGLLPSAQKGGESIRQLAAPQACGGLIAPDHTADFSLLEDLFKHADDDMAPRVAEGDLKVMPTSGTPDGSTVASEEEEDSCPGIAMPLSSEQPAMAHRPAELGNIWDDFGEW